jgi:hypothetical protein
MSDTELIDYLQGQDGAALISDDFGNWAVSSAGMQIIPDEIPGDVDTTFFVRKHEWHPNIRDAILAYKMEAES